MSDPVRIPLTVSTESPGLWSSGEPVGNTTVTLDFIPGSVMRGWAAWRFIDAGGDPNTDAFRRTFLWGNARFTDCRPDRAVAAPLSLYECKRHPLGSQSMHPLIDRSIVPHWGPCQAEGCGSPLRRTGGWLVSDSAIGSRVSVAREITVHNTIDPDRKRPFGPGGVYSLECVSAGQAFSGSILAEQEPEALLASMGLAPGEELTAWLGRGRANKGLGRVRIIVGRPQMWAGEIDTSPPVTLIDFLSRAILHTRDGESVASGTALVAWASEALELGEDASCTAFANFVRVAGHSGSTGLPRESAVAVAAGSCVAVSQPIRGELIGRLVASGVGERRSEGFGEIAVNHKVHAIGGGDGLA